MSYWMSPHRHIYRDYMKPLVDRLLAGIGLIVTAPLLTLLALAIRCKFETPMIFAQTRAGRYGQPFRLYKFRTMTNSRDGLGQLLPDSERLTPFGRWLRSTSLDELPELWNVFRGDMSLIGPRPLLMEYLPHYTTQQSRRHEVLPGLTGWAQVHGRNITAWDERFAQDVWYVDNLSFSLDMWILWRTLVGVWTRHGISAEGHATMPRFDEQQTRGKEHGRAA